MINPTLVQEIEQFARGLAAECGWDVSAVETRLNKRFTVSEPGVLTAIAAHVVTSGPKNCHATTEAVAERASVERSEVRQDPFAELIAEEEAAASAQAAASAAPIIDGRPAPLAKEIARKNIEQGSYVIFFPRGQKGTKQSGWQELATRDMNVVKELTAHDPYSNVGLVGKPDGNWYFDDDDNVLMEYENQFGKIPTRRSRSVSGGTHLTFRQNDLSRGMGNISGKDENGGETWSARVHNKYIVAAGSSAHPNDEPSLPQKFYEILDEVQPAEAPEAFITFLKTKHAANPKKSAPTAEVAGAVVEGGRNNFLAAQAAALRNRGLSLQALLVALLDLNNKYCSPPLAKSEVDAVAQSFAKYEAGTAYDVPMSMTASTPTPKIGALEIVGEPLSSDDFNEFSEESIPKFNRSVIKGIYKEIVDELILATTLEPQYIYAIAKTLVGAKMAGRVTLADLDVVPLNYLTLCGPTGAGKGEAWRRMLTVMKAKPENSMAVTSPLTCGAAVKIINSADSGAGLKDAFFEHPEDQPILCYIDEVKSLGNKAEGKKNPEIIDTMGELADSTSVSRVKAKRGKQSSVKSKDDAHLAVVMCGQNAEVFTSAFVGRTNVGWWDRLVPEYGTRQEAGKLPPVAPGAASRLLTAINSLPYSGTMANSPEADALLESYWASLGNDIRTTVRLRQQLQVDAYIMSFGRGSKVVEASDMAEAIDIFKRQLVIRKVMFRGEAPDRTGYYLSLIKDLTQWMRRKLAEGVSESLVARSHYDFETKTNARRNNEEHIFERAWAVHAKRHLCEVLVKANNGRVYTKYLPVVLEGD